jgi:hypothetical protein
VSKVAYFCVYVCRECMCALVFVLWLVLVFDVLVVGCVFICVLFVRLCVVYWRVYKNFSSFTAVLFCISIFFFHKIFILRCYNFFVSHFFFVNAMRQYVCVVLM